jgi:hypothetical protein
MGVYLTFNSGSGGSGTGQFLEMVPSVYTPSSSPMPASFLVSIDNANFVSTPVVTDSSGNPNFKYNLAAYVGDGRIHNYEVMAQDGNSPPRLSTAVSGQFGPL